MASTQKTCVCFHGNSSLNTSPSRWSGDEGFLSFEHRLSRVYSGETSRNESAPMTRKLVYAVFMSRGDRSATEGCTKWHMNGTQQKHSQFCLASRTFMCLKREKVLSVIPQTHTARRFCVSMLLHMFSQVSYLFVRHV